FTPSERVLIRHSSPRVNGGTTQVNAFTERHQRLLTTVLKRTSESAAE
ncbi:hypothetical protein NP493_358g00028, partial [Ridgeia piscesae]